MIKYLITLLLIFFFSGFANANPKNYTLNDKNFVSKELKSASLNKSFDVSVKMSREFKLNPLFKKHESFNVGDTINLGLFSNKEYSSVLQSSTVDVNGVRSYVSKLVDFKYAYCFISVSDNSSLITIDIPELNEKYTTRFKEDSNNQYLVQLDENKLDIMEEGEMPTIQEITPKFDDTLMNNLQEGLIKQEINKKDNHLKSAKIDLEPDDPAEIDILVVYTNAAKEWANTYQGDINTVVSQAISSCNLVSENSDLGITFNLVFSYETDFNEYRSSENVLSEIGDGNVLSLHALRDFVRADLVILFTYNWDIGDMELKYRKGNKNIAYSVSSISMASWGYNIIHKIGHNLGAHHHKEQLYNAGPMKWYDWQENTWSAGWRWTGEDSARYCSVMTSEYGSWFEDGISNLRVPYFSNPEIKRDGIVVGHIEDGNNAYTIRKIKHFVASYYSNDITQDSLKILTFTPGNITKNGVSSGGIIVGNSKVDINKRGVVWSLDKLPELRDNFLKEGSGYGQFNCTITGLKADSVYYVRAFVITNSDTLYGQQIPFLNNVGESRDFITVWEVPEGQSKIDFFLERDGDVSIHWENLSGNISGDDTLSRGDGLVRIENLPEGDTVRVYLSSSNIKHFYNYYFPDDFNPDSNNLLDIEQWGTVKWGSMSKAFYNCKRLNISAKDIPDFNTVLDMNNMFYNCESLNGPNNINEWILTSVTNMDWMFCGAKSFNQNIGDWDVSNVLALNSTFSGAESFNQDIGKWSVSKVISMFSLFGRAKSFNQDIGGWDVSNVVNMGGMFSYTESFDQDIGSWDVSNVNDMSYLFYRATMFNQDLGDWDVSSVIYMKDIFSYALSFNQELSDWKLNSNVQLEEMILYSGIDCSNYSKTLIGWSENKETPDSLRLHAKGIKFNSSAIDARQNLISKKGWTITGDSEAPIPGDLEKINGPQNVCPGQKSFVYSIPEILNAEEYEWDLPEGVVGGSVTNTITVDISENIVPGNISVKGINGCGEGPETILSFTVSPAPEKPTIIGDSHFLMSSSADGNQWINENGVLDGAVGQLYKPTTGGNYFVAVTKEGCSSPLSDPYQFFLTGVNDPLNISGVKIFPNPVSNELIISSEMNNELEFELLNNLGQVVLNGKFIGQTKVETSSLESGTYFLRIKSDEIAGMQKLVKL